MRLQEGRRAGKKEKRMSPGEAEPGPGSVELAGPSALAARAGLPQAGAEAFGANGALGTWARRASS